MGLMSGVGVGVGRDEGLGVCGGENLVVSTLLGERRCCLGLCLAGMCLFAVVSQ